MSKYYNFPGMIATTFVLFMMAIVFQPYQSTSNVNIGCQAAIIRRTRIVRKLKLSKTTAAEKLSKLGDKLSAAAGVGKQVKDVDSQKKNTDKDVVQFLARIGASIPPLSTLSTVAKNRIIDNKNMMYQFLKDGSIVTVDEQGYFMATKLAPPRYVIMREDGDVEQRVSQMEPPRVLPPPPWLRYYYLI